MEPRSLKKKKHTLLYRKGYHHHMYCNTRTTQGDDVMHLAQKHHKIHSAFRATRVCVFVIVQSLPALHDRCGVIWFIALNA